MAIDWKHVGKLAVGMLIGSVGGKFIGKKAGLNSEDIVGLPELGAVIGVSLAAVMTSDNKKDEPLPDLESDKGSKVESYKFRNAISEENKAKKDPIKKY